MSEKYFRKVELRRGFALPELYLRMEREGVIHHGKDREDWLKNLHRGHWEPRVRLVKPPALSCASWVETLQGTSDVLETGGCRGD
jgi:hypothetical protein